MGVGERGNLTLTFTCFMEKFWPGWLGNYSVLYKLLKGFFIHGPWQSSISQQLWNMLICKISACTWGSALTHESEILGVGPAVWVSTSPCYDSGVCSRANQCSEVVRKSSCHPRFNSASSQETLKSLNGRFHLGPTRFDLWTEMPTIWTDNIIWGKINPYKYFLLDKRQALQSDRFQSDLLVLFKNQQGMTLETFL